MMHDCKQKGAVPSRILANSARTYVIADTSTGAPVTPTDPPVLFLLYDDVSSTGKRILFWMSPTFLAAINNRSIRIMFIDGTFKTTPKFFTQTWIVRCYIGDSTVAVPFCYILLEDKSTASYLRALQLLSSAAPLLFPATVMVDFETTEHTAIRQVFPHAQIRGCLFHFKQCIKRHLTSDIPGYSTSGVVRGSFNAIYGLAFIDPVDIDRAWVLLRAELLRDYPFHTTAVILFYVESTWLYNRTYPRDMWSVYHSIILKDARTNNVSEASNNAFNIAAAASHLAMPKYVKHLQLFNAEAETTYLQQSTYLSTRRGVRPRTENNK